MTTSKKLQRTGGFIADMVRANRTGEEFKKPNKNGAIRTKPTIPCEPKLEKDVLKECISLLIRLRCGAKRMNVGKGAMRTIDKHFTVPNDVKGTRMYGIMGAADITGVLPDGRRLEVECKHGKGGVWSEHQQDYAAWIRRYNGVYLVVHSADELKKLVMPYLLESLDRTKTHGGM